MAGMAFERIAVLGPGLLGGSIGLAVQERGLGEVRFWGRSQEKLAALRERGFLADADLAQVVEEADLVVLATPVGCYADLAAQLVELGGEFLVTDVGSVKGLVHSQAGKLLSDGGIPFIGSHPMAGSEQTGFGAARADLFEEAFCFLTLEGELGADFLSKLQQWWESLGCRVQEVGVKQHDEIVARISHLPHVLAALGAQVGLRNADEGQWGGGGLRDTTRVAAGDPAMWAEILLENREAVLSEIDETESELRKVRELLAKGADSDLQEWLQEAKNKRDGLC